MLAFDLNYIHKQSIFQCDSPPRDSILCPLLKSTAIELRQVAMRLHWIIPEGESYALRSEEGREGTEAGLYSYFHA